MIKNLENYKTNRTGWPSGEWETEPDVEVFVTACGYTAVILRMQGSGCVNGYVQVPKGSNCDLLHYDESLLNDVEVHGGLTFAGKLHPDRGLEGWFFGFDTAHAWDITPARKALFACDDAVYRNWAYVKQQTESLAVQLFKLNAYPQS